MPTDLKSPLTPRQTSEILSELQASHDEGRNNQVEARRKWNKIEAYVEGRQMSLGGPKFGAFYGHEEASAQAQDKDIDKELFISNEMRRIYMQDMQRLTSYQLKADVIPPDKSPSKKVAARAARIFLNNQIATSDPSSMKAEIARLLTIHNFAAIKVHWNPRKGRYVLQPRKGILGWFKGWMLGDESRPEGEIEWSIISGRNLIFPKYCESLEKADWVEEIRVMSVSEVWRTYGVQVEGEVIKSDYGEFLNMNKGQSEGGWGANTPNKSSVLLKERWIRPCPQYERGAIFVWGGGQLIRSSDLLTYYPDIPYFSSRILLDEKDVFGASVLWDLIPLQNMVNLAMSANARYLGMLALLRMWLPDGCDVSEEDLTNSTGVAVPYKGDKRPEWDRVPEMNQSVINSLTMARDLMSSYGYSNEFAKQKRAYSGNALGMLQEMDDTVFKGALDSIESMFRKASNFSLKVAAKYIDVPRLCRMTSMQGWQMAEFKGSMVDDTFNADVNLMTGMPTNKVMRLEFLKALYKDGLLSKEEVKGHLEFATDNDALEQLQKQLEIADARIEALLKYPENYSQVPSEDGLLYVSKVMYHQFDNHQLLVAKLQSAMQESFDHWNPWIQTAFLEHWKYAKDQALQQAQEQAQLAAPQGGGGGQPEFPGPPEQGGGGGMLDGMGSNQAADQQPPQDLQPQPMNGGAGMGAGQ